MKRKVIVTINRGRGNKETFTGTIIAEGSSFYKVTWQDNPEHGEWFAKKSDCINCSEVKE